MQGDEGHCDGRKCTRWGPVADERAVSPVIGVVLLVAIVVVLSVAVGELAFGLQGELQGAGPTATFGFETTEDSNGNDLLLVTHTNGDTLSLDRLLLVAEKPVDLGGSNNPPNQGYATTGEKLDEGNGQVGIGDTWESGETIQVLAGDYGSGADELDGVTIRLVWNPREVDKDDQGGNAPSSVVGESSVVLFRYTV